MVACIALPVSWCDAAEDVWPRRPIQVIVPYAAGGDSDMNARIYLKYLEPLLGANMAVINVGGGAGSIGARRVKDARPDGYTALFYQDAIIIGNATGTTEFTFRDFELPAIVAREGGFIVAVKSTSKWKTMRELVDDTVANPEKINITGDIGGITYLISSMLNKAGAKFNIVSHGGASKRLAALLGGHVDVAIVPLFNIKSYADNGEVRLLATMAPTRSQIAPDLPTVRECGYDVAFQVSYFFMFPKGTPQPVLKKMGDALEKIALSNKDYADDIQKSLMQEPFFVRGSEAIKIMEKQESLIKAFNLQGK
jgi:tripartite-type tricarboxylate transporter receptor subunit TctC